MVHAWTGYERVAFGHDEVRPVTNRTNDSWNGWGVTLVDALDTLWLMGLVDEFKRAVGHVATISFKQVWLQCRAAGVRVFFFLGGGTA